MKTSNHAISLVLHYDFQIMVMKINKEHSNYKFHNRMIARGQFFSGVSSFSAKSVLFLCNKYIGSSLVIYYLSARDTHIYVTVCGDEALPLGASTPLGLVDSDAQLQQP